MNDLSLALIRKGKGTGVVAGTTSHDLELALAEKYGNEAPVSVITSYLTFSSASAFTLAAPQGKTWDGTLMFSLDGVTWVKWFGEEIASQTVNGQDQILLGGYGNRTFTGSGFSYNASIFEISGSSVSCTGDIRTLLDFRKAELGEDPKMLNSCFYNLFYKCTALATAPTLPALTLSAYCYQAMFYGCTGLETAPALPATTLAEGCYSSMFYGCTGLTSAPALPATTLKNYCYQLMFLGCTALTSAPAIPATTVANSCCQSMFQNCTALTSAPAILPATTLANWCYQAMFYGCAALQNAPALPATTLADNCYYVMFSGCASLTSIPALPATTLAEECYGYMFQLCSSLKFALTPSTGMSNAYRIPASGTGTTASGALTGMFFGTSGTFTGDPSINTTYYTNATIVPAA